MGVSTFASTLPGGVTPVCNHCGVALCWDISVYEYDESQQFWDDWICRDCNGREPMSLKQWKKEQHG